MTQEMGLESVDLYANQYWVGKAKARENGLPLNQVRVITREDIPQLLDLEKAKWGDDGASAEMIRARIENTGGLCWAVFSEENRALASCFVFAADRSHILNSRNWYQTTSNGTALKHIEQSKCWFGISLAGRSSEAVSQLMNFLGCEALRRGIQEIYLGSTLPGYSWFKKKYPDVSAEEYAFRQINKNGKLVCADPLIEYYTRLGFEVVKVLPDYFHSPNSENYGALICLKNPVSRLAGLFKFTPNILLLAIINSIFPR